MFILVNSKIKLEGGMEYSKINFNEENEIAIIIGLVNSNNKGDYNELKK